jgi:hypothetical protein
VTIWLLKRGRAYEASADRCPAATGWCCSRKHAREHLTLDSARHARDGCVIEDVRAMRLPMKYRIMRIERI